MSNTLGLYIHIPFCRSKCPYCDFFSYCSSAEDRQVYVDKLCEAIANCGEYYSHKVVDTVYIGGGTPSVLESQQLVSILECVKSSFHCNTREVTVECNPSTASEELLRALAGAGVNRISLGLQSAVDSERKALGRLASVDTVRQVVSSANSVGISNISVDLMLGVPNQTSHSLRESLSACVDLGVQHISAYILKVEEGTVFAKRQAKLNLPSDEETADLYKLTVEELTKAGFNQYEVSNFAKPGFESQHNLKYWKLEDYLGIGPGAHSFVDGNRFYYPRSTEEFLAGCDPVVDGTGGDDSERVMLSLRLASGLNLSEIKDPKYRDRVAGELAKLSSTPLVQKTDTGFSLTSDGFLVSNSIISKLI